MGKENESWKKHISQMNKQEEEFLRNMIDSKKVKTFSKHLLKRKNERDIDEKDILSIFSDYSIIEYNRVKKSHRCLIRGNKSVKGYNICLSIDIFDGVICTVYKNENTDHHKSINMSNYNILDGINIENYIKLFS